MAPLTGIGRAAVGDLGLEQSLALLHDRDGLRTERAGAIRRPGPDSKADRRCSAAGADQYFDSTVTLRAELR